MRHQPARPRRRPCGPLVGRRVPGQQLACGWCGTAIEVKATGRLPKWCSETCRHRAWEQTRAAASGNDAVRVIDRPVLVTPDDVTSGTAQLGQLATQLRRAAWPASTAELDRIGNALDVVLTELEQRARYPGYDRWPGQRLAD